MSPGAFNSNAPATPAVTASGTDGASGAKVSTDTGTGLNVEATTATGFDLGVQVGSVEEELVPEGTGIQVITAGHRHLRPGGR